MSIVANQPANLNIVSGVAFRFNIKDAPHVSFFCQSAQLPGVSLGETPMHNPFAKIYKAGDVTYEPLAVRFIVDEDLKNYLEVYDWIRGLGHPTNFIEYKNYRADTAALPHIDGIRSLDAVPPHVDTSERKSDATLTILTNKLNGNIQVHFKDCFPVSIGAIDFDLTNTDISSIVVDVSFRYTNFVIENTI